MKRPVDKLPSPPIPVSSDAESPKPTEEQGQVSLAEEIQENPKSLLARLHHALGPITGGVILDSIDLVTFGPIGILVGPFIGFAIGWWISSIYRFSTAGRITFSTLAALYIAFPFTEVVPLATLISVIARFYEKPHRQK